MKSNQRTLTYKMNINYIAQETKEVSKKIDVAFKSTIHEQEDDSYNEDDEKMTTFARKFKRSMKFNKVKRPPRKGFIKGESSKKEKDSIIFYECKSSIYQI